jgi:hypothetical protein
MLKAWVPETRLREGRAGRQRGGKPGLPGSARRTSARTGPTSVSARPTSVSGNSVAVPSVLAWPSRTSSSAPGRPWSYPVPCWPAAAAQPPQGVPVARSRTGTRHRTPSTRGPPHFHERLTGPLARRSDLSGLAGTQTYRPGVRCVSWRRRTWPRVTTRQEHGDADRCRAHPDGFAGLSGLPCGWDYVVVVIPLILLFYMRVYRRGDGSRQRTGHRSDWRTARRGSRVPERGRP